MVAGKKVTQKTSEESGEHFSSDENSCKFINNFEGNFNCMVDVTLGDWRIKYEELEFGTMVRRFTNSSIHRGQWHGDVVIHSHQPQNDNDVQSWLADVRTLTHIRHENIVLYMGACVEPPKFAIITQPIKAESLYTHVMEGKRMNSGKKLSIIRQVADAFSYLHAKGIVHGRLSAHNIFLESRVKVSLLDHAAHQLNLQYYSPEIARELNVNNPYVPTNKSPEGDIFSFGTFIYFITYSKLPIDSMPAQTMLWTMANQGLALRNPQKTITSNLSKIMNNCWSPVVSMRPTFFRVCSELGMNQRISNWHSVSEPKKLNQVGKASGLLSSHY